MYPNGENVSLNKFVLVPDYGTVLNLVSDGKFMGKFRFLPITVELSKTELWMLRLL